MAPARCEAHTDRAASLHNLRLMRLNPNTHAFVVATAFLTSYYFTVTVLLVVAYLLGHATF